MAIKKTEPAKQDEKKSPTMEFLGKGKAAGKKAEGEKAGEGKAPATKEKEKEKAKGEEKKAAAKAPEKKKHVATGEDLINDTCAELENLKKDEAFKVARDLIDSAEFNDFKLGGVLSVIQSQGYWEGMGYENFKAFIEGEFGLPYRKAMYLIQIYNGLVEAEIPYAKVQGLGWSKLKELAPVLNKENVDSWVEKATAMTVLQLIEAIKAANKPQTGGEGAGAGAAETVSTLTFKVHKDQKETIRTALDQAKKAFGTEFDSVALEQMAMAFMEKGTGKGKVKEVVKPIEDQMKELGWEGTLDKFGEIFPAVDITVDSVGEGEAAAAGTEE